MRNRISQYSLLLVSFFVLLFSLSLIESVSAGTAPPKISPTEGDAGHPFTLIDPQEARLVDGAVAVFQAYGTEVVVPLRTHKPHKTAQGRLPQDMYGGEYTVVVRNLDGSEFVIGTFTVLGVAPAPPSIQPDIGAWGTEFMITDPLGRIQTGDLALFYAEGSDPSTEGVPADNVTISPDGMTLTGNVPYAAVDDKQNYVAVRPSLTDPSRFGDLGFFVTIGPQQPSIDPTGGPAGTLFTITDPYGRMETDDVVLFYPEGSDPVAEGHPADNVTVSADGITLTGYSPQGLVDGVQHYVTVREFPDDVPKFGDLPWFVGPNLPPSFTSTPVVISDTSSYYTYDADATDPNAGDILTFSLITSPAGASINPSTGLITWWSIEGVGDYPFEVQVEDQDGLSAIQAFTVTVSNLSGEGCDAAFWMANTDLWMPGYPSNMLFVDAFGINAFPGFTLHQIVSLIAGYDPDMIDIPIPSGAIPPDVAKDTLIQLGINAVAALQNAATSVHYDLDIVAVILSFQQAYLGGTVISFQDTAAVFENYNNQVCPF